MLIIKSAEEIKNELLSDTQAVKNFPKSLNFPFDPLYIDITTRINTREIASECILFDSLAACNETKAFSDADYWIEGYTTEDISQYWIFGQNGQGDLWLFDADHHLYFYDHNKEQMSKENFVELDLRFDQWLQFADLNKQLDDIYEIEDFLSEEIKAEYKAKLSELSANLYSNYPFDI